MHVRSRHLSRRRFVGLTGGLLGVGALARRAAAAPGAPEAALRVAEQTITVGVRELPLPPNPFQTPRVPALYGAVLDPGIVFDPETMEARPWLFSDWNVEGGRKPAVDARLREGLTWNDGTDLTAEDVAFTVSYLRRYDGSFFRNADFSSVDDVTVRDERSVRYRLVERSGTWLSDVLAAPVLPKHVWEDVDTPTEQPPPGTSGLVGSGPFRPADVSENRIRLRTREDVAESCPHVVEAGFLDADPLVGGIEFRPLDRNAEATVEAVANGSVTVGAHERMTWSDEALGRVGDDPDLRLRRHPTGELRRISLNVDRTPFDDVAFRQFLRRTWNDERYLRDRGPAAMRGDLVVPPEVTGMRPFDIDSEQSSRFSFLGTEDGVDVERAREYLLGHPDASHDYSFELGVSDASNSPDGNELYVNHRPLTEAHNNTSGAGGGLGPLEVLYVEGSDASRKAAVKRWAKTLRRIGVPATVTGVDFPQLIDRTFRDREFDMFDLLFGPPGPQAGELATLYGTAGINDSGFSINAMGYTGASEPLGRASTAMDPDERADAVREALARIYLDMPVLVYEYPVVLDPVPADWRGWVPTIDGVANRFSWLNADTESMLATPTPTPTPTRTSTPAAIADPVSSDDGTGDLGMAVGGIGALGAAVYGITRVFGGSDGDDDTPPVDRADDPEPAAASATGERGDRESGPTAGETVDQSTDGDVDLAAGDAGPAGASAPDAGDSPAESDSTPDDAAAASQSEASPPADGDVSDATRAFVEAAPGVASAIERRAPDGIDAFSGELDDDPSRTARIEAVPEGAGPEETREFVAAVRQWANISTHENVLSVLDWAEEPRPWVAFETARGGTLAAPNADLSLRERVMLVGEVCDAIRHASLYNSRHLVLRPEFIRLAESEGGYTAKVGEWGLGSLLEPDPSPYAAPEQLDADLDAVRATDIYRLGAIAYRILGDRPPYDPDDPDLAAAIRTGEAEPLGTVDADLEPFEDAVSRAMSTDVDVRYGSAHHFRMDLLGGL
jgi:ABC-type transport system substrate-binding protein